MDLGKNISYFRNQSGFSQESLAATINVSRQTVYKWESNIAIPRADHIIQLVKAFNISYNDLFREDLFEEEKEEEQVDL